MEGVINLLKTPGGTSHDCINSLRRILGQKRVGHTGTLDPMACGVLPICVGKATRLVEYTLEHKKTYRAEMLLGLVSDTQDLTGQILSRNKVSGISEKQIVEAMENFMGPMEQITPAYSAVKYQGKKFYELARQGLPVPKKTRNIFIYKISLFRYYPDEEYPRVIFDAVCSKGTYMRTLCSDLGKFLGPGAVMSFLVRTASGPFLLENTIRQEEIESAMKKGDSGFLMPMGILVEHLPCIELKENALKYIQNGVSVNSKYFSIVGEVSNDSLVRLECNGRLIGMGTIDKSTDSNCFVKPKKVLI